MSIFDDDNEDVRESVRFFNQLSDEEKIRVVSDLNPFLFQQKQQYRPLFPLLSKIQKDISKHDEIKIGTKLVEYGLDETYARLFVSNVKKHAPTEEYQLNQLDKIPDEVFCSKLADMIKDIWINDENEEVLSERYGVDREKIRCLASLTGSAFNGISRGIVTKEKLEEIYKRHMSEEKTDALMNQILVHQEHQHKTTLFANAQDMLFNTRQIIVQNREILRLLQELVDLRKEERREQRS